jgi:hypothetical protein
MFERRQIVPIGVMLLQVLVLKPGARADEPGCGQALVDGTTPPATAFYIYPRQPVTPFYQWENNRGYCGEVSMMIAGLNNGQWMSQYNARLICGTGLSQSGVNGACAAHNNLPNYNAQLLIEDPNTGVTGPNVYADAAQCIANSRLNGHTFQYTGQQTGLAGYEQYMSWMKSEVIAGHQVAMGVLLKGGDSTQYDHEVAVIKIGTNHSPSDPTYYSDDVLYFDDHGVYTLSGSHFTTNPSIPPGAGTDTTGCTVYVFGYTFGSLPQTRQGANASGAQGYSIIIPGNQTIVTGTGGTGYSLVPIVGPHNYAFSVAGVEDTDGETVPVSLAIGQTTTNGVPNPLDPIAGYNYENPMIGTSNVGLSCTNSPPASWMSVPLQATVSGLTPGTAYNLYEYDFSGVSGTGASAALAVPTANFNANAALATRVTPFLATGSVYTQTIATTSDKIVVFRCVPASAP